MKKIKRYKRINEDEQIQQQTTAPAQPVAPAQNNAQPQQTQQPAQNQQQQPQQGVDMNAAVANINKFVGETFKVITDGIKNNFEKSCPEVLAIAKDQQSPVKDAVKKLEEAYGVLKKLQVDPAKADVVATAITAVNNFIAELTGFASQLGQQNQGQQQPQQNVNQQPAQNNTPTANNQPAQNNAQPTNPAPAAPAQNNTQPQQQQAVNASKEYADFGHILQEKLRMKTYEKALWRQQ